MTAIHRGRSSGHEFASTSFRGASASERKHAVDFYARKKVHADPPEKHRPPGLTMLDDSRSSHHLSPSEAALRARRLKKRGARKDYHPKSKLEPVGKAFHAMPRAVKFRKTESVRARMAGLLESLRA